MIHTLMVVVMALVLCLQTGSAQEVTKVAEPDFINHFEVLNVDGSLTSLKYEPQHSHNDKNKNVTIYYMTMDGEHCPVRVPSRSSIAFVVRLASPDIDPGMVVNFFRLSVVDGRRRVDLTQTVVKLRKLATVTNTTTTVLLDKSLIKFDAGKYGAASATIKPTEALPAGEYGLAVKKVEGSYCFGVD